MKSGIRYFIGVMTLCFFCNHSPLPAQHGFVIKNNSDEVDIPFEYQNHFMIVTVRLNGLLPIKMIFDTGAEHTLLTKSEIATMMGLQYDRSFSILGSDLKTTLTAYLSRGVRFEIPNAATAPSEDILVLEEDYFRFEEFAGVDVHGILSGKVFSNYFFKINYQKKIITLYSKEVNASRRFLKGYTPIPISIFREKPYLQTQIVMPNDSVVPVKLLLDTGAGLPMLIFSDTHPLLAPPPNAIANNIGMGLGGYIDGFIGRIDQLNFDTFHLTNVVTYFQILDSTQQTIIFNRRNGIVGNGLLNRFFIVFDYHGEKMWIKPVRHYQKKFYYDRSGLTFVVTGGLSPKYTVMSVLPRSPAAEAGLRAGDVLVNLQYRPDAFLTLPAIQQILRGKPGKSIHIVVKRQGKRLKKRMVLRDLV